MRTGRLSISRGHERIEAAPSPPRPPHLALVTDDGVPDPEASDDLGKLHARLTALERLAELYARGVLSSEEFAAEKARLVAPAETAPQAVQAVVRAAPPGPSLFARLGGWKLLPLGLVAGVVFSFVAQPQESMRFIDDVVREMLG